MKTNRRFGSRNSLSDIWGCVFAFAVAGFTPRNAIAQSAQAPINTVLPKDDSRSSHKERNGAEFRPIAIRLEGTLNLYAHYSVGITGGYAFHRLFALEGTLGWEGGFMPGIMTRLRIPITPSSSVSLGLGATMLWVLRTGEHSVPGTYLWFPGEVGYEYREKEGFTFLIGLGGRLLSYAKHTVPTDSLCIFCLEDPPKIIPAARFGIGWAF